MLSVFVMVKLDAAAELVAALANELIEVDVDALIGIELSPFTILLVVVSAVSVG